LATVSSAKPGTKLRLTLRFVDVLEDWTDWIGLPDTGSVKPTLSIGPARLKEAEYWFQGPAQVPWTISPQELEPELVNVVVPNAHVPFTPSAE
jgi:hypothetical protein